MAVNIYRHNGFAPVYNTAIQLEAMVKAGTITSSPGPIPNANKATCKAAVPLATATACLTPKKRAKSCSNRVTKGPAEESQPVSRASLTFALAWGEITGSLTGIIWLFSQVKFGVLGTGIGTLLDHEEPGFFQKIHTVAFGNEQSRVLGEESVDGQSFALARIKSHPNFTGLNID